jgi:dTDP-4-dehydrorhamnose reductase
MKILVFGKNGQVASEIKNIFSNAIFFDRDEANFLDPELCAQIVLESNVDIVINTSAYTDVDGAESEFENAILINGVTPGYIASACKKKGIPLIHISSDYIFPGNGYNPWVVGDKPGPINSYGKSKLLGENEIIKSNCQYVILRTSWVFSQYSDNFVKTMLKISKDNRKIKVVSDQIGGPTSAFDIAKTCLDVATFLYENKTSSFLFHYAGYPNVSWSEFAKEIFLFAGIDIIVEDIPTSSYPTLALRPLNSRLDCNDIYLILSIERPFWKESLKNVVFELSK